MVLLSHINSRDLNFAEGIFSNDGTGKDEVKELSRQIVDIYLFALLVFAYDGVACPVAFLYDVVVSRIS